MPLTKFDRYTIEFPGGARSSKMFRTRLTAVAHKKLKKLKDGKVIKVTFRSSK